MNKKELLKYFSEYNFSYLIGKIHKNKMFFYAV